MSQVIEVIMPRLSDSMEEGTIVRWLKADGADVSAGENIAEIETDKATMEFEADAEGTLTILVSEGETCSVGTTIALIGDGSADSLPSSPQKPVNTEPVPERAPSNPPADSSHGKPDSFKPRILASPLARRIAREMGVNLDTVIGGGTGGRIRKSDVLAAAGGDRTPASSLPASPRTDEPAVMTAKGNPTVVELNRVQQVTARKMAESKATAPDFVLEREIDMEAAVELRDLLKRSQPLPGDSGPPSYNDMVVRACALALRDHPRVNGSYKGRKVELYDRINIGIAVAAGDVLIVPIVFDADRLGLRDIAVETRRLAGRVRDKSVTPPELSGGTFTVSNLGMLGVDSFTPVINPPQAAILGVGALRRSAAVEQDESIVPRHTMKVTLTCDHRILSGASAAGFLARIAELLESPGALIS